MDFCSAELDEGELERWERWKTDVEGRQQRNESHSDKECKSRGVRPGEDEDKEGSKRIMRKEDDEVDKEGKEKVSSRILWWIKLIASSQNSSLAQFAK